MLLITLIIFLKIFLTESQKCDLINPPENGYFIGGYCSNELGAACGIKCRIGYKLIGSSFRQCTLKNGFPKWSGSNVFCQVVNCRDLEIDDNVLYNCTNNNNQFGTKCYFSCPNEYKNIGSSYRYCLPIGIWSGLNAKCRKLEPYEFITENDKKIVTNNLTISTTKFSSYFLDLSKFSFSFGYSFKKVNLNVNILNLPSTFEIWIRTNYTKNIKILNYRYKCFNISVLSNENSGLLIDISFFQDQSLTKRNYLYDLNKNLTRNTWLQLILSHLDNDLKIYINGVPEFSLMDFQSVLDLTICYDFLTNQTENEFKITDDLETKDSDYFQPMRGEITRVYLYGGEIGEENILQNYFKCEKSKTKQNNSDNLFDWSNVLINDYLHSFKRKPTSFCQGCKEPDLIKHALMYYDGTKNGDVLLYNCQKGYKLVGQASSICMIYGEWSHKTPRCKRGELVSTKKDAPKKKFKINKNLKI